MNAAAVPILEVRDLVLAYPGRAAAAEPVLDGVSLSLERGQTLGLVGESGSGKTSLAHAVMGLVRPSSGSVHLFGECREGLDRQGSMALKRRAQMVFQDPYTSLDPSMTSLASVAEPLSIHGIGDRRSRRAQALRFLAQCGIDAATAARHPARLSGGQRQRVAIARALATGPELLICDEPVSALDVSVQAQVLNLLKGLCHELGLAMLFISHDLAVVRFIADRVAVLQRGRIVEQGTRAALFAHPVDAYTKRLLSAATGRRTRRSSACGSS